MTISRIEPGSTLLHYRLVEELGQGGMGVVWKAVDTTLDREVAIKILPEALALDGDRLARFQREAKLLASLNHPNVASIYGFHSDRGVHFLAMELVRGGTLRRQIESGLTPMQVVDLAVPIADGLAAAHRHHVVHRDLKPENVMIDEERHPKLLDFGLARIAQAAPGDDSATEVQDLMTRAGTVLGTVAYMSPEQAQGMAVGPASDIFSFGTILYEMTTGRRPFSGKNSISLISSILRDTPEAVWHLAPAAPAPLVKVILRCLEKDPEKRYADGTALRDELVQLRTDLQSAPGWRMRRSRVIAAAAVALLIVAALTTWIVIRSSRQRWVREQALPQLDAIVERIQMLEEGRESWDAFVLARKIEEVAPADPLLARLRPKFTRVITIESQPPGAAVYVRYYDDPTAPPLLLGTTPLVKFRYPRGITRLHLELNGRSPVDDIIWNFVLFGDKWSYHLPPPGEVPAGMAFIPAGAFELVMPGLEQLEKEPTAPIFMDVHEVTNREYKQFVAAGGYNDAKYWREEFIDAGRVVARDEAMKRFVDRTGRPGPSSWEVGSYPDGQDEYPVSGVSWYEASAYAAWAGKSLPTIFHWNWVAFPPGSSRIVPMANLASKGPRPVNRSQSANRFGVNDLAGNVREWALNTSSRGERFILGGGWNDPDYAFADAYAQLPFDRSATNGFRCIKYAGPEPNLAALQRPVERPHRDFRTEKPVSDELFAQYLRQFSYDNTPLDAKIEEQKQTQTGIRQKISFRAAYGGERMFGYLWLPTSAKPPYQVVVMFPGSGAIEMRSSASLDPGRLDFIVKSGRAVFQPIYKHTYERGGDLHTDLPSETSFYKDSVVMWGKDLRRSIDYLETRPDIDATRIAYFGLSWGGAMGAIMPAIEKRIKVNVLYVAGFELQRSLPEADQLNYVTRVRQPTLMLNGELDFYFPTEISQRPMFEMLGTRPEDKKRLVFPGGHSVPRTEMIRESLAWLDHYFGVPR